MLTDLQVQTVKAIVNVFETGHVLGDYAAVTLIPGDTGQLTYGRAQTTLTSGGLHDLVADYCRASDGLLSVALGPYLPRLSRQEATLNTELYFHNLLRAAADDPAMRTTQDSYFDGRFLTAARLQAGRDQVVSALGVAVVYDSFVHGAWRHIRNRTRAKVGDAPDAGERRWISAYVKERHDWLANHRRADLRKTVYRMAAFRALLDADDWALELPIIVRRREISSSTLDGTPPGVYDGPALRSRSLAVRQPVLRGADVRQVQLALSKPGFEFSVTADGIFGGQSRHAVERLQSRSGRQATGIVEAADFDLLGL